MIDLTRGEALLAAADEMTANDHFSTHWEGCHTDHPRCMVYRLAELSTALLAELRAARQDAERLDFLLNNMTSINLGRPFYSVLPSTDRDAIDAAMRGRGKG